MTVDEESDLRTERDGKLYYFCSNHCLQKFLSVTVGSMPDDKSQVINVDNTKSITSIENIVQDENLKGELKTSFIMQRMGLATLGPYLGIDFSHVNNKDASFFPVTIPNHAEKLQLGMVHRPLFSGSNPEETACQIGCREIDIEHESIWISYCPISLDDSQPQHLICLTLIIGWRFLCHLGSNLKLVVALHLSSPDMVG